MKHIVLLTTFIFGLGAFGSTKLAAVIDGSCRQSRADSTDKGWRVTEHAYNFANRCLDTRTIRPIVILENSAQRIVFQNFYDHGQYWTATWEISDRPLVHYLGVHFPSGVPGVTAGHTELRFIFSKGLALVSQSTGEQKVISDVVVSWHASLPVGAQYDLITGMVPNFPLAGRILSRESRYAEEVNSDGTHLQIDEYRLLLSRAQGAGIFAESVALSNRLGLKTFYLTLDNNCTTTMFNIIDQVLMATDPQTYPDIEPFYTPVSTDPIIGPARNSLIKRFLIDADP